ncbi:MAG: cytochrome c oxidase subunit 3 [Bacteroidota bacterium]
MSNKEINLEISHVPQGRLGLWILIAGELMIFGGLIACYLLYRIRFPEWANDAAHTSTLIGAINTIVLLSSSFTVVKAHEAAQKRDYKNITKYMTITIFCGLLFLVFKSIEYITEIHEGHTLVSSEFFSFYFLMTGLHGLHVVAGMVTMLVVMLGARKGENLHRVELAGMYWHMVDLIWIFLFPLLYIAK